MFRTERISTGYFAVYWDERRTRYMIINGCSGLSGHNTPNIYGIESPNRETMAWIGTLQLAKKTCAKWLEKAVSEDRDIWWSEK